MIVAKFGGSSLADTDDFLRARDILAADPGRRYVVVSAPGKRNEHDVKITDILLDCHHRAQLNQTIDSEYAVLNRRFRAIARGLGLEGCLDGDLAKIKADITEGATRDFIVSRGEYLCARLFAEWLCLPFIDATEVIRFNQFGKLDLDHTLRLLRGRLLAFEKAVIPGFYGADSQGQVHTFTRGGSDVTGALAAAATDADLYEKWTDVTGFRAADPHIVPDASYIASLTYRELRELSYMGASVMHEEAVFPVRRADIPTRIKNVFDPEHPGTIITHSPCQNPRLPAVTGIAGKRGFSTIILEKNQMNDEISFGRKVLSVLENHHISFEHLPTGIDALCVMVSSKSLLKIKETILDEIEQAVHPDTISLQEGIALVSCVGMGIFKMQGTIARLFTAVSNQGIAIRTMFQAPSDLSIIIGVNEEDLEAAIRAIYDAFIRGQQAYA